MPSRFGQSWDYAYLFNGAAFFLLGTACLVLFSRERDRKILARAWLMLAGYGFAQALHEWLDMIVFALGRPTWWLTERALFVGIALVFLAEFLRRTFGIVRSLKSRSAALRGAVAWALALLFLVYEIYCVVAHRNLVLSSFSIGGGVFVSLAAIVLVNRILWVTTSVTRRKIRALPILVFSFLMLYGGFLAWGARFVNFVGERERQSMQKIILANARLLAGALGGVGPQAVHLSPEDATYANLRKIHQRLVALADLGAYARGLYLISFSSGHPEVLASSRTQVFSSESTPLSLDDLSIPAIRDAVHAGQPTFAGPFMDHRGRDFFATFIPFQRDPQERPLLLAVSLDGGLIFERIESVRLYAIFVVMAFLVLLVGGYGFLIVFALKNLDLEIQKANLDNAVRNLREAEAELSRSEETFRGILNNSPNAIFGFDRDLRAIFWNQGAERVYGYTKDEVVDEKDPTRSRRLIDLLDIGPLEKDMASVFTEAATWVKEVSHRTQKGTVEVLMTVFPVKDPQGHILFGMGLIQDISEHKSFENKLEAANIRLKESHQRYKELVDNLRVGVYVNTPGPEGKFIELNPAMVDIFEADSFEQLLHSPVSALYQNPDQRKLFNDKLLAKGFLRNEELDLVTLKGRPFIASLTVNVKRNEAGQEFFYGTLQDITEQKRLEMSLAEERTRLRTIATHIGAGLCLIDNRFRVLWFNEVMEGWFGKLDQIEGKECFGAFHQRTSICDGCPTRGALETGELRTADSRVDFPNGRVMYFSVTSSPVKNEHGVVEQVLELVLDVTERRRMIELLEYERALSKNVIDSIADPLIVFDAKNKAILDVNRAFVQITGFQKHETVGKTCFEIHTPLCAIGDHLEFNQVLETGHAKELTYIHRDSSGAESFYDISLSPLKDDKGQVIGLIHIARDVSDRKRMEAELKRYSESLEVLIKERTRAMRNSELMFRRLFESAQDGILIIDAESAKIISVNPALSIMLACPAEELQGKACHEVSCFAQSPALKMILESLKEKSSVFCDDVVLKTTFGQDLSVEMRASLYFVEKTKVAQVNIRDITDRKKLDKVKTEFVSMVSHELRTPLSAIKEGVEIVADGTQGKLNRDQKECLGIALSNIRRLNRLIGDILDISKIQSNLLKVSLAPCPVGDVIDQVYNLMRIEIEKRGLVLVTDLEKGLPLVMADKDRLIQVLMNLLNNAVKFTRENSKVLLAARAVKDQIEFSVRDEGPGIAEEEVARLFGRFVQLDSTLVRRVGGTGLGLYISKNLVEAMGGRIWAESKIGEGSVFKFVLPMGGR